MRNLTSEQKAEMAAKRAANKLENPPTIHQITKDYRIVGRESCLNLEKLKNGTWTVIGYHTELGWAINSVAKHVTRDHLDDLLYLSGELSEIKELCKKLVSK